MYKGVDPYSYQDEGKIEEVVIYLTLVSVDSIRLRACISNSAIHVTPVAYWHQKLLE
jgi:hypothetical protein